MARDEWAAKAAYEEMLRRAGVSPVHRHAWEGQTEGLRRDWVAVVRAAAAAERERVARVLEAAAPGMPSNRVFLLELAALLKAQK